MSFSEQEEVLRKALKVFKTWDQYVSKQTIEEVENLADEIHCIDRQ